MKTGGFNLGCGIISLIPVIAGHYVFINETRYILLSWFSSCICTVLLIFCSLSSLFTKNPWVILGYSLFFDVIGKVILKWIAFRQKFLVTTHSLASLGFALGLGYSLSHVMILYLPICFDQPYSVDYDLKLKHPYYFPNSLDLAISYHCTCLIQIATSLFLFKFSQVNIIVSFIGAYALQYGYAALSQITQLYIKVPLQIIIGYGLFIAAIYLMRLFSYQQVVPDKSHKQTTSQPLSDVS